MHTGCAIHHQRATHRAYVQRQSRASCETFEMTLHFLVRKHHNIEWLTCSNDENSERIDSVMVRKPDSTYEVVSAAFVIG